MIDEVQILEPQRTQKYSKENICLGKKGALQSRNPFCRYCSRSRSIGNWLIVALIDVHDRAPDDASCGFRVDMHRQGERTDVRVILHEIDLLDEERRRFHRSALGSHQASGVNVDVDSTLEQANTFLTWLYLVYVHHAALQFVRPLVREFVICRADRVQRRVILLQMIHFRLQQPGDDIRLYEAITSESHRLERECARSQVVLLHFVFAVLRSVEKLSPDQGCG